MKLLFNICVLCYFHEKSFLDIKHLCACYPSYGSKLIFYTNLEVNYYERNATSTAPRIHRVETGYPSNV